MKSKSVGGDEPRAANTPGRRDPVVLGTTLVTALASALLLGNWATGTGLWCDELLFLRAIELGPLDGLRASGSSHPPFLRWMLAAADRSWSDAALRAGSVVCAVGCVFLWSAILRRVLVDRWLVALALPSLAFGAAWTAVAYQLVPYAPLGLLGALHVWSWFLVLERPGWKSAVCFTGSAVLASWTHFFGLLLPATDLVAWIALAVTVGLDRNLARVWAWTTAAGVLLVAPLVPILLFYVDNDRPYPIREVTDVGASLLKDSRALFGPAVLHRTGWTWAWVALHVALAAILWGAWRARGEARGSKGGELASRRTARGIVIAVASLMGLPALQLYALALRAPLFERYVSWIAWTHVVALLFALTLLPTGAGRWIARAAAAALLVLGGAQFAAGVGARRTITQDWTPVVAEIDAQRRPGDAFYVQDMDQWSSDANFDRLWFERYGRGCLPIVHGRWMRRAQVYRTGLALDGLDPAVERVWVFSSLFGTRWLARMPQQEARNWRLVGVRPFEHDHALALFARARP